MRDLSGNSVLNVICGSHMKDSFCHESKSIFHQLLEYFISSLMYTIFHKGVLGLPVIFCF